jgi:small subunit ribosomal protein S8
MTDPVSDLIIRIKNASAVGKESVTMPYSKMKEGILTVLEKEGYVKTVAKKGKKLNKSLEVTLAYGEFGPHVKGAERISHLSKRVYRGVRDLHQVKQGQATVVLTTPKGIMTDKQARKEKVGGEVLFNIW